MEGTEAYFCTLDICVYVHVLVHVHPSHEHVLKYAGTHTQMRKAIHS